MTLSRRYPSSGRRLVYIANIYEILTGEKNIYRRKRITLPAPEFIVL